MRIYCAGPIFTHRQRAWLRTLGERLRKEGHDAFVPAEAEQDFHDARDTKGDRGGAFQANLAKLAAAQLVAACLDGADADAGTSWEVGFAFARRIPVLGYRSDYRSQGKEGTINLMLEQACAQFLWVPAATEQAMLDRLREAIAEPLFPPGGKLVRDKIPETIKAEGRRPSTRKVRGEQLEQLLRLKVLEEAGELLAAFEDEEVAQELADIQEAAAAVARHAGVEKQVEQLRAERAKRLGVFDKGVVLEGLDAREE